MKKLIVRDYQRGNPRKYKNVRLDPVSHEKLHMLSQIWEMSFLQVLEKLIGEADAKASKEEPTNEE